MPPYQIIQFARQVGAGVTGAWWASVRAILKQNSPEDPYCVANELICSQLGQFLGLPIPPCGLFVETRNRTRPPHFGTLNFNLNGDSLPPAYPPDCIAAYSDPKYPRPDHVTGTLLFDVWIANGDRHERNLALDTSVTPHQLHVFDHSWALFGRRPTGQGMTRLNELRDELGVSSTSAASGNRHCLLDSVRSNKRFGFWLDRLRQVPEYVIRDTVDHAYRVNLIDGGEAMAAVNFLTYRRSNLANIITNNRSQFTGISDENWEQL